MAVTITVIAKASITISIERDILAEWRFYQVSSSMITPSAPTEAAGKAFVIDNRQIPTGWSLVDPGYDGQSTNSLYTIHLTSFSNGDVSWSTVSKASDYEISKEALVTADNLHKDVHGNDYYQLKINNVAYDVWQDGDNYYYKDNNDIVHVLTSSQVAALERDSETGDLIVITKGGIEQTANSALENSENMTSDIYGTEYYQLTISGVTYDVWYDQTDDKYRYITVVQGEDVVVELTPAQIAALERDPDTNELVTITKGGIQQSIDTIINNIILNPDEPSVTIKASGNLSETYVKITDTRIEFIKSVNGEEITVAYIDSTEDEGVIDINNARIHDSIKIGKLEMFEQDEGIGIRRSV